ncbi:protein kinase [Genlisea aurea]|uniref:Protein kinase n=1 Tax=Genlisea aurea TaxID=192259 RepID=S8CKX4_9LAMI|nr:protein kinase [Genlisea aurea]
MCRIDDADDLVLGASTNHDSLLPADFNQSLNPMCEPSNAALCKFDESPELTKSGAEFIHGQISEPRTRSVAYDQVDCGFTFVRGQLGNEDDDEETEAKIRAFLEEKALELKKLQTPLYDFYKSLNLASSCPRVVSDKENISSNCNLPPKSRSPNKVASRRFSTAIIDSELNSSPGSCSSRRKSNVNDAANFQASQDVEELVLDSQQESYAPPSSRFSDKKREWEEELAEELERTRGKSILL